MKRDDYKSVKNRKKQTHWINKISTAKHKEIIHFMITGETEEMVWYKEWKESNVGKTSKLHPHQRRVT